jgi:hypothetical protein
MATKKAGAFRVRRLVAAFNSLMLPHTGSLLPGMVAVCL